MSQYISSMTCEDSLHDEDRILELRILTRVQFSRDYIWLRGDTCYLAYIGAKNFSYFEFFDGSKICRAVCTTVWAVEQPKSFHLWSARQEVNGLHIEKSSNLVKKEKKNEEKPC